MRINTVQETQSKPTRNVALITGASSGIGEAIARTLYDAGYALVLAARRLDRLRTLAESFEDPSRVMIQQTDLRDPSSIGTLFTEIRAKWGGVDVLINNAGLGRLAPLTSGDEELWREMLEVNVLALCICTREAVSDMRRRGDEGHVIHVSSMASHRVPGGSGVYSATKFAVRSLTEGLRLELRAAKSKIRVGAISPGFVETEFAEVYHGDAEKAKETYSQYRVLDPQDIASTVLHMLQLLKHVQIHDVLVRPTEQPS